MNIYNTILLSIVEGITEFLPVSSTAHINICADLMNIRKDIFFNIFEIFIQLGAILSSVFLYRKKFLKLDNYTLKIIISVIPILIIGAILGPYIENILNNLYISFFNLILGGIILIFIDNYTIEKKENISSKDAFIIGLSQCFSIFPGVSRSASTIISGAILGIDKKKIADFSFIMAVPTMLAANLYSLFIKNWNINNVYYKGYDIIINNSVNLQLLFIGVLFSFILGLISIKIFILFLKKYGFKIWGIYRIILGIILIYSNFY